MDDWVYHPIWGRDKSRLKIYLEEIIKNDAEIFCSGLILSQIVHNSNHANSANDLSPKLRFSISV